MQTRIQNALNRLGFQLEDGGSWDPTKIKITAKTVETVKSLAGKSYVVTPDGQLLTEAEANVREIAAQALTALDD